MRFVNAGSVGLPYEGDGAARWLWVADGVPELRQTAYDAAAAGRRMLGGRLARRALGERGAGRARRADGGHPRIFEAAARARPGPATTKGAPDGTPSRLTRSLRRL